MSPRLSSFAPYKVAIFAIVALHVVAQLPYRLSPDGAVNMILLVMAVAGVLIGIGMDVAGYNQKPEMD